MKAKIKPRINLENRTRLETVIPLSQPMILFVDPSSSCNFQCKFCPTGDRELIKSTGRWQGAMDFELFQRVIDDLESFDNPLKVLRLYKEGEPLMNKRFADMVKYAKESGNVQYIDTTTNGYLLDLDRIKPAIDSGLDRINISVDGLSDEQFMEFTGTKVNFERFVDNIRILYENKGDCEICIKIPGDKLREEEKQFFYQVFGDYADRISIENFAPCWPEFDIEARMDINITDGIYGQQIGDVDTCPYIFYSMSVNSDGSVSLCFLDWSRKLVIGDVRKQSLKEIWHSDALFNHQINHLHGKRKENEVCGECGQLSHCLPDNLDPYVSYLAERLMATRKVLAP